MPTDHRSLRVIARTLRVIAWCALAAGVIIGLMALVEVVSGGIFGIGSGAIPSGVEVFAGVVSLVLALIWFAVLYGAAELIELILDIEASTGELARRLNELDSRP